MARTLKIFKGEDVVESKEETKRGEGVDISINGLDADTEYPKGTYQAAWEENRKLSKKKDVPAFHTDPVLVSSITFSPNTAEIEVDQVDTITPNIKPGTATNSNVTYESSNPEVLTVDSSTGEIRGIKVGEATVTATANDKGGKSGQIEVTVTEASIEEDA